MKRHLILAICVLCGLMGAVARPYKAPGKGYRGFAELGYSRSFNDLTYVIPGWFGASDTYEIGKYEYLFISTTSGYQFNSQFFLGAGIKIGKNVEWDIPVFVDARYDFRFNKVTPFADFKIGYNIGKRGDSTGIFFSPTIGYRFNWGREVGLNIGVGLSFHDMVTEKIRTVMVPPIVSSDMILYPEHEEIEVYGTKRRLEPYLNISVGIDF